MHLHPRIAPTALALVLATGFGGAVASAQGRVELEEARAALQASVAQNRAMQAELDKLRTINSNLSKSLIAANTESEQYRKSYAEMRLQMEALGIKAVTEGEEGVQSNLVKAVNDLRLLEEERRSIADALMDLSDASLRLLEASVDLNPEARAKVEKAIDAADVALGLRSAHEGGPKVAGSLHEGQVVSVKKDYGVVVLNVGREGGVKVGMPFELRRKDRPVGSAIVVAVRDNIAAALVERLNLAGDTPQVGDLATVATTD